MITLRRLPVGGRAPGRAGCWRRPSTTPGWGATGGLNPYVYVNSNPLRYVDFAYTPSGALASYTSGNGIVNTVEYNDVSEPTHVASSNGAVDLTYTYDAGGNVTGIADPRPGMTASFGYDALDRLTSATGAWGTLGYQYDALGSRLSSTLNGVTTTCTYDPATNRLASTSGGQVESFCPIG